MKKMTLIAACILTVPALLALIRLMPGDARAYPLDGYADTGIRRLERLQLIKTGKIQGKALVPGASLAGADIRLNLAGKTDITWPLPEDGGLQERIAAYFRGKDPSYHFALVDITPGRPVRAAAWQDGLSAPPGSVGKLAIAAGLFTELKKIFPDPEQRKNLLRSRLVTADRWAMPNHHEVPFFNLKDNTYRARAVAVGDVFSLYEWTDHMLSASSNAAASIVWKEVMLMQAFGTAYPPDAVQEEAFFKKTKPSELRRIAVSVVNDPLRKLGITVDGWQLGSFFTSTGKKIVPGISSYATPAALLQFMVSMEAGQVVDDWSSLELKKMLYMTARRIRYAFAPALNDAAVYFKSGSQYSCRPEPGFACGKYMGNVQNMLNSVAVVEHPDGTVYIAVLMSNVLRKNSASDHAAIAGDIDRIVRAAGTTVK